ncbi:hypothetical protein [Epibacterium ulvae]|uniref:hypothetical protein n=1 Tax=Epibacterium ulvae TaxID=1156985 RepID=UPI00248FF76A|nr:hypothetical protein [Epibacterium ulvae]
MKRERTNLQKQIEGLMDRIIEADSPTIITAYEKRIDKMEREKLILDEKLSAKRPNKQTFDQLFEHACDFLSNPCHLWENGSLIAKKKVLRLAFAERISYSRERGFRTPKTTLPFKVLEDFSNKKEVMADRGGFEPPTP